MKPHNKVSNERLTGVSSVTITFVWNFQANAHSGRTTLMLNEKNRNQSNKEATLGGQSTWISYENKLAREPASAKLRVHAWSWNEHTHFQREHLLQKTGRYHEVFDCKNAWWEASIYFHTFIHSHLIGWMTDLITMTWEPPKWCRMLRQLQAGQLSGMNQGIWSKHCFHCSMQGSN